MHLGVATFGLLGVADDIMKTVQWPFPYCDGSMSMWRSLERDIASTDV